MFTKITKLAFGIALLSSFSFAQRNCGSAHHHEVLLQKDPSMKAKSESIERHTAQWASKSNKTNAVITIPVVVHVLYNTATQNISDAQIQSQIDVLNEDFRKLNADRTNVPSAFSALAVDAQLNFCLAKRDPNGAATTGITRTSTSKTAFDASLDDAKSSTTGGKTAWPSGQYLNLWVVPSIKDGTDTGILGYAQFPGGATATDGVVIGYNYFGRTGTVSAPYNKGRTATHEVGHWLNLRHIWGDANCGSDLVSDTPTQQTANYGCPTYPHATCSNTSDMFMNYMDYVDDACMYMFSAGQSTRMSALFATGGARASLATSLGCTAPSTGGGTTTYCASLGTSVSDEWIAKVAFSNISNTTTANAGYGNFTTLIANVNKGTAYTITLTPGYAGSAYTEYWKVWIDYNQNGSFSDAGELVYTPGALSSTAVSGSITIPTTATTGTTRMRVQMKYNGAGTECETFSYGEVEDYSVNIGTGTTTCGTPTSLSASAISSTTATLNWVAVSGATSYNVQYKTSAATTWTSTTSTTVSKAITGLTASTSYQFQVAAVCGTTTGTYSTANSFTTSAATVSCGTPTSLSATSIASTSATLNWVAVSGATSYNVQYKTAAATTWTSTTSTTVSKAITGLTASTSYQYKVAAVCGTTTGTFSTTATFTTTVASTSCTDSYETNETNATAKAITVGTTANAYICPATDIDFYSFANTTSAKNINVSLTSLPGDYDLFLYNPTGTLVGSSENTGTTSETIKYNNGVVGTYKIKVIGYNGATSSTIAYKLLASTSATAFKLGDENEHSSNFEASVYPNPAQNELNVMFNSKSIATYSITIVDMLGRVVNNISFESIEGENTMKLDLDKFDNGIYFIKIQSKGSNLTQKFTILK